MKTIKEIFETNPSLLEEKEVKELIEQFAKQYNNLRNKHQNYFNAVTDLTMFSELFVINGESCKDALIKIHEISFK